MIRRALPLLAALTFLGLPACSSGSSTATPGPAASTDAGSAGDGATAPPAGPSVTFEMQTTIAASAEDERCKFVTTTEDLWIHQEQVRYTPGSHHFILWNTTYTSIPTTDINGNTVDTSGVFECPGGPPAAWTVDRYVGGSQAANAPNVLGSLPDDVALHITAGSVLMMDLHVLNASANALPVTVTIDLQGIPASQARREAGIYFFYNPFIAIPPNASSHAEMSCPVTSAVTLTTQQTHMHKWGLGGVANLEDSSGKVLKQLYTSDTWSDPAVTAWTTPPMTLQAGQQIEYECNYQNDGDTTIIQGLSAQTNEMCVLVGAYYPRDTKFETCGTTGNFADQGSAATFIGTGTATCFDTLDCLQGAMTSESFFSCMVNSCPSVATPLTQVLDCQENAPQGSDVNTVCKTQIGNCIAATCSP
jgi:hypothetical protein